MTVFCWDPVPGSFTSCSFAIVALLACYPVMTVEQIKRGMFADAYCLLLCLSLLLLLSPQSSSIFSKWLLTKC